MTSTATPDAETRPSSWVDLLPEKARDYARLARFDRPIGTWLLFWPCGWGMALSGGLREHWPLLLWFGLGSIAMRGAGCVYNDIVDRDLDAQVERTRDRPLASGRVRTRAAWAWLVALALVGLVVLLQIRWQAQLVALGSLALIAAYPFMKRITWWPQAWLGLTFNWGIPVAWIAVADPSWALLVLYAAGVAWTLGYDTIYALQDIEDDAMAGIKSSARALGDGARAGVAVFYTATVALLAAAIWLAHPDRLAFLALVPAAIHLTWQVLALGDRRPVNALRLFRSNRTTGLLVFAALAVVGLA